MSTKTSIKRIALVAVSALGFGLIGAAPSRAAAATGASGSGNTVQAGVTATMFTATLANLATNAADTVALSVAGPAGGIMTITTVGGDNGTDVTQTVAAAAGDYTESGVNGFGGTSVTDAAFTGSFNMPGIYTVTIGTTTTTTATVTVVAGTSTTSTLTATATQSGNFVTGTDPVISVTRNTGGALTDGLILARVDSTVDSGVTVGQILGEAVETVVTPTTTNTTGRTFTFANGTFDTAGSYTFTIWNDANANNTFDSGEVSTTASFTVAAAAASTSLISASLSRTLGSDSTGVDSVTVTATITDADGNPSTCDARVAETDSTGAAYVSAAANNNGAGFTNASNTIGATGTALIRVGTTNTYTGTFTINASLTSVDYVDTYLTVYCHSVIAATATTSAKKALRIANKTGLMTTVASATAFEIKQSTTDTPVGTVTSGVRQSLTGVVSSAAASVTATVDKTYTTHSWKVYGASGQEGEYVKVTVAPAALTANTVVAPTSYMLAYGADLVATVTVTATAPAAADGYTLTVTDGTNTATGTITFATAAPSWSVSPSASFKAKFGDTSTVTGTLSDQFGRVLGSKPIYVLVTGRQAGTYNGTTAADGTYAFTWKDTNAATTVTLTDVLTFNYPYYASAASTGTTTATSASRTVTYSATGVAVGSILVSAPSDTNTRPIDMDAAVGLPAIGSRVTYTATVYDAAGAPVTSGALVTFTGGADDLFYGGSSGVTDALGQASVVVYRTKVGAPAIKATAGGVTSAASAAVQWTNDVANNTAASAPNASSAKRQARYITLAGDVKSVVSEGIIRFTAKVTDRWGNAVEGAQVTFAETGAGRFYNPPTSNQVNTNAAGEASIDLNSQAGETGAVSVTATITESSALQAVNEDAAGIITNIVADATPAYTGTLTAVAGVTAAVKSATATATITKDTSVSTADALLELAKAIGTGKEVEAATDAAAEAIDAANAATDAANLAAEAADAATVAAEEARDAADAATAAVEELSTQVASLMSALKAQLTTLANTVAKIAKKVKA